jgi:hypothetical protein
VVCSQEGRSCLAWVVERNRLQEGCQGHPTRLQDRRRRHRSPLLMLGVGRSTYMIR